MCFTIGWLIRVNIAPASIHCTWHKHKQTNLLQSCVVSNSVEHQRQQTQWSLRCQCWKTAEEALLLMYHLTNVCTFNKGPISVSLINSNHYLWLPCIANADIFLPYGFYLFFFLLSSFFPHLISAVAHWISTILLHMVCLSASLECRSQMCCTWLAGNTGHKNDAKNCHLCTIAQLCWAISSQLRHVSSIRKKSLSIVTSSTCPHNMVSFGPLTAEIGSTIWGTPANFNWFRVLAALLHVI